MLIADKSRSEGRNFPKYFPMAGSSLGVMDKWIVTLATNVKTRALANQRTASDHVTEHLGQVTLREFSVICQPEVKINS